MRENNSRPHWNFFPLTSDFIYYGTIFFITKTRFTYIYKTFTFTLLLDFQSKKVLLIDVKEYMMIDKKETC